MNVLQWLKEAVKAYRRGRSRSGRPAVRFVRLRGPEELENRVVPATVNMYWDPTNLLLADNTDNWDVGSLGSGTHPTAPPGKTNGELDNIYFDGSNSASNRNCTWDYKPPNTLGFVAFQKGYSQTVTFNDKCGFSVSSYSYVTDNSSPTITPNGSSGTNAVAAITLTNGNAFEVTGGSTLNLSGWSTGNAIFFASGDQNAGEYLSNGGTVAYKGTAGPNGTSFIDYMKIPVLNDWKGVFTVNGSGTGGSGTTGSTLQVSGADPKTNKVSFYENSSAAETDISGNGTLWCVNDYWMDDGLLQTKDSYTDNLEVGTGGSSPVDGTVTLNGGSVNINPGTNVYGTLQILGTTKNNAPTLNVGAATINFKVNMATTGSQPDIVNSNQCDQLIVGNPVTLNGIVNFNQGGTSTVNIIAQGTPAGTHQWKVMTFGKRQGQATVTPTGMYKPDWSHPNDLTIDYPAS